MKGTLEIGTSSPNNEKEKAYDTVPSAKARLRKAVRKLMIARTFTESASASMYGSVNIDEDPTTPMPTESQLQVVLDMILPWRPDGKLVNWLLVLAPIGYWSHAASWPDWTIFLSNFLVMIPIASLLGDFTEELSGHMSATAAGLLNATFGNAVEVVVAVQALAANEIRVVQASMLGSVLSNLLLVLGSSFIAAGIKYDESQFSSVNAVNSASLLLLSSLGIVLPSAFETDSSYGSGENGSIVPISRFAAFFLLLLYIQVLVFQLKTHAHLTESDETEEASPRLGTKVSLVGLLVCTLAVSVFSDWLVDSIDGFTKSSGLGKAFVGVILLPIVGNAVEHVVAVQVAYKGKMELAMGVALGSAVQVALFVVPVVVMAGWMMGREMSLAYPPFEVAIYLMSTLIVAHVTGIGRSNWIFGSTLVTTYFLVGFALLYEKSPVE